MKGKSIMCFDVVTCMALLTLHAYLELTLGKLYDHRLSYIVCLQINIIIMYLGVATLSSSVHYIGLL